MPTATPFDGETSQKLCDAALDVYRQFGYLGATTRRIADAAGVNEVTLFRLFGSKDALLKEGFRRRAEQVMETTGDVLPGKPRDPETELTHWCELQLDLLSESLPMMNRMMSDLEQYPEILGTVPADQIRARTARMFRYVEALRDGGHIDRNIDVPAAVQMIRGTLLGDALARPLDPDHFPPRPLAAQSYARLFLRALGSRTSKRRKS